MLPIVLCWYTPEFSLLWHPFLEHSPITFEQGVFIGYCTIVWMSLVAPLLMEVIGRLKSAFAVGVRRELKGLRL